MAARKCSRPGCGWSLDGADREFCCFCTGKKRICACKSSERGQPVVASGSPCPRCGSADELDPTAQMPPMRN